jgi:DNA-3-methyladenine glycosylase II
VTEAGAGAGAAGRGLPPVPGHRFAEQLAFLGAFPAYTAESVGDGVLLWYRAGTAVRSLELRPAPGGGVAVAGDLALARAILRADAAPLPPASALPPHPTAHRLLHRRYGGIRPVLFPEPFEGICWAILGQQVTVAQAARLKADLARRHGEAVRGPADPLHVFPGPERVAALPTAELRAAGLSRQKAGALSAVAAAIASGAWDPEGLRRQPEREAMERLERFPGVGRWTAEYVLLRVAGHPDVLPAGDAALQRAWARLQGRDGRVDAAALRAAGAAWAGWRSDFAFCLWLHNREARRAAAGG